MPHTTLLIVLLVLMMPLSSAWSSAVYSFRSVDSRLGLSSGNVKCIAEDAYGFVWLGTKNGLHRFDGAGVRRFDCYDHAKQRGNNNIDALYEDEHRRLWVGTDRGVYIYDQSAERFAFVDAKDARSGLYADNWVQTIDGDGQGNVWVCLPDRGVFHYHDGGVELYNIPSPTPTMKENIPTWVCVDAVGEVWVATSGMGIYRFNKHAKRFDRVTASHGGSLVGVNIVMVVEDTDGTMVMAANDGRLYRYDPSSATLSRIAFAAEGRIYLRYIHCFDTEIWVGAQHGLYVISKADGSVRHLLKGEQGSFGLTDNIIYCLYESRNGDAWVGTAYGGACHTVRGKFSFDVYGPWSGLRGTIVNGLAQGADGRIWVGTEDAGLFVLNHQAGSATAVRQAPDGTVLHLSAFNGKVYAGYSRGGLVEISSDGSQREAVPPVREADNSVYAYLKDSRGGEWVGYGYALYRREAGQSHFSRVAETGYDWIFALAEAHDGTVWIGTMGNGLWRYCPQTGRYKSYVSADGKAGGLRSNSISAVMEDSQGRIWVSTDRGGISLYDKSSDSFTSMGIEEGLPDDVAYNILEDSHGCLWFGTNKGLVKYSPDTHRVRVFTTKDGLPSNQFNYNSALKAADGRFYFGCVGGVVAFSPEAEDLGSAAADVYFTRLTISGEPVEPAVEGSPLDKSIMFAESITLSHRQSTFALDVVAPGMGVAGQCEYSYKLEPVAGQWVSMADGRISFANMSPGSYRLTVMAQNHGHKATRQLTITVLPPWWASLWARLAYAMLLVGAAALWFVWYRGHKEKQLRERQRLFEANKEKELYQSKIDFFTEVAHEIRTPLTLIDAPLEAMEEMDTHDKRAKHYLSVMRQNTKRLLNLTGQLLDFQKIDSHRLAFKYENTDVAALVEETASRFEPSITLRGKRIDVSIAGESIIASTDREALTKILSNLLNNAMKYARQCIGVSLTAGDTQFVVSVTSDGDPIAPEERGRIFERFYQIDKRQGGVGGVGIGLPLARSLAQLLGGTLTLDEGNDEGNTFTVTLPLNKDGIVENNRQTIDTSDYLMDEDTNQTRSQSDGYTVLIVEDNDEMREFLAEQSCQYFAVETAGNGREALDRLANARIDLIVTDVMMPVMDGFELCKAVKADINLSHIPVVFITAKNDLDSKIQGLRLGAEAYIEKPFSVKYFRQLISSLLDNRRREREMFQKKPFFNVDSMRMTKADEEFMSRVVAIIESNVGEENFNVEAMADMLCMSHSSLLRKIKSVFSMSPVELIRTVKLKKAAELIQEGKYLIGDICYMVGIASPSYFSKLFFKQFGISPKDFEKQCREKEKTNAQ